MEDNDDNWKVKCKMDERSALNSDRGALTAWGTRAARVYDDLSADRYRDHDNHLPDSAPSMALASFLSSTCARCGSDLTVLDVGCGTGRYFWALGGVRTLVGLDASPAMLARAHAPYAADRIRIHEITLIHGDLLTVQLEHGRFDLVYSIGVLAEYTPLTAQVVDRIANWLKPGGRFAFSAVRPDSPTVPRTLKRRLGRGVARWAPGPLSRAARRRLLSGGLYADAERIRELLSPRFAIESLEDFQSESHLHHLCVARLTGVQEPDRL